MSQSIEEFLKHKHAPPPDLLFDACLLDPHFAIEAHEQCPLQGKSKTYTTGCYAWIELGEIDEQPTIMYVGKAARLRNRLGAHFRHSKFIEDWAGKRQNQMRSFMPFVAVWFTEERAALESKLIKDLLPYYNKQKG